MYRAEKGGFTEITYGIDVGMADGVAVGLAVGLLVGLEVGIVVGFAVGLTVLINIQLYIFCKVVIFCEYKVTPALLIIDRVHPKIWFWPRPTTFQIFTEDIRVSLTKASCTNSSEPTFVMAIRNLVPLFI